MYQFKGTTFQALAKDEKQTSLIPDIKEELIRSKMNWILTAEIDFH